MTYRKFLAGLWLCAFISVPVFAGGTQKEAADVMSDLNVQGVTFGSEPTVVQNGLSSNSGIVSFGAEKEGVDYGIANVMSPTAADFKHFVKSLDGLGMHKGKMFLKQFLGGIASGEYRQEGVKDVNGVPKNINFNIFQGKNIPEMHSNELLDLLDAWLAQTGDKPFSFIKPETRFQILEGKMEGNNPKTARSVLAGSYKSWVPQFGTPEKYITIAEPAADYIHRMAGWEIQFKVQKSYGEFEKFLDWFSDAMKDNPKNKVPGHHRIVWPNMNISPEAQAQMNSKTAEMYKNFQALIVMRGIAGNTGIMTSKWKEILNDKDIAKLQTWKGVLRAEHGRWPNGGRRDTSTWTSTNGGIEFRAGTKDPNLQRFFEKSLVARVATNDWGKIQPTESWKLVPESLETIDGFIRFISKDMAIGKHAERFGVDKKTMIKFFSTIKSKHKEMSVGNDRRIDISYLVPLWYWERAPYLSDKKKEVIKSLTKDLIHFVAEHGESLSFEEMQDAIKRWAQTAAIDRDIEYYLTPKREYDKGQQPHVFTGKGNGTNVDVNKIDMGIEYTGRMPIKTFGEYEEGEEGFKKPWVDTDMGLAPDEREAVIFNLAKSLSKNVGNPSTVVPQRVNPPKVEDKKEKVHGHGIDNLSFFFKDPNGGEWRVEWDGIGRDYTKDGEVVPGSTRGGHIELVTPRFHPNIDAIKNVYKSFTENSVIPGIVGGGHVNVDLAPFKNKPREFAKFLSAFHKYRGTMAMMFQSAKRLKSAEPVNISKEMHEKLKDWKGSEEDLKKFLYNNKYYNDRVGRKTRYIQNDIACYYQDVIPAKYISQDFDINNPTVLWRQQFRVRPNVRKMEFRMMDAPRTVEESALMIKAVRALMNKALNDPTPVTGDVQEVDYEKYAKNPQLAFQDLKKMTDELGLSYDEYKGFMGDGISNTQLYLRSKLYKPYADKVKKNPHVEEWDKAVDARPENAKDNPSAETQKWELENGQTLSPILPIAVKIRDAKIRLAEKADAFRLEQALKIKSNHPGVLQCFKRHKEGFGLPANNILEMAKDAKRIRGELSTHSTSSSASDLGQ